MKRKLGVYIGRFSPWHKGHEATVVNALKHCDNVLILIGSPHCTNKLKNPWTYQERKDLIKANLKSNPNIDDNRITIQPIEDSLTMSRWVCNVQSIVHYLGTGNSKDILEVNRSIRSFNANNVYLLGYEKDTSSSYLNVLNWDRLDIGFHDSISATPIRDEYFKFDNLMDTVDHVSTTTLNWLYNWRKLNPERYDAVIEEYRFQIRHDAMWANAPYPPIFHTVDSIVVQNGHVLLVRRKNAPGKGTWAIPGGYLNVHENIEDGAVRELIEETGLKLPKEVLKRSIVKRHTETNPSRSSRGRIITDVMVIELRNDIGKLPHVRGQDDAEKAKWFSFFEVREVLKGHMFEDHYHLITHLLDI